MNEQVVRPEIVRVDKYNVKILNRTIRATPDQETKLRNMTDDELNLFVKIHDRRKKFDA